MQLPADGDCPRGVAASCGVLMDSKFNCDSGCVRHLLVLGSVWGLCVCVCERDSCLCVIIKKCKVIKNVMNECDTEHVT